MTELKKKSHLFQIKNKTPGQILTGPRTEVLMDGLPLKGCSYFKFEVGAAQVAKVTIELTGDFAMTNEIGELQTKIVPLVPRKRRKTK